MYFYVNLCLWQIADELWQQGLAITVSDYIEQRATYEDQFRALI